MQVRILRYWLFGIALTLPLISSGCGEGGGMMEDSSLPQAVQDAISAGLDEVEVAEMEEVAGVVKPTGMSTIFHIDYASPVEEAHLINQAQTDCGDASSYKKLSHKWTSFPVYYFINASNSGTNSTAKKDAVVKAFATWDAEEHPAGDFFRESADLSNAKVTVSWQLIDGPGGTLAYASTTYYILSKAAVSSRVVYDSGDTWQVFPDLLSCTGQGKDYAFDVEDVGAHEIGHVVGLGHTSKSSSYRPLTMYPYILHVGETLKRTLGTGDRKGLDAIY